MFYILEKELKNKHLTREKYAELLGIGVTTVSLKLNQKSEFTLSECKRTQEILDFKGSINELFKSD